MSVVALLAPGLQLTAHAGALRVLEGRHLVQTLRPHQITEVQLHGGAHLTAGARRLLLREGVDVVYFDGHGTYLGRLSSATSRAGDRRLAQLRAVLDPARRLRLATAVVAGKIANQRAVLLSRQRRLRDEELGDALVRMRALVGRAGEVGDLDELRGVEGLAARVYFGGLGRALRNAAFRFEGRNRRPPRDPVNACLSFGYALLVSRVERAVWRAGLDPYVGFLHEATRGAPALALDLAEELRPAVDGAVLSLLNRRQLTPEDFRTPTAEELGESAELGDRAVYLGDIARKVLLAAWEQRLAEREAHPRTGEEWTLEALLLEQARQVARVVQGDQDVYVPLSLRR